MLGSLKLQFIASNRSHSKWKETNVVLYFWFAQAKEVGFKVAWVGRLPSLVVPLVVWMGAAMPWIQEKATRALWGLHSRPRARAARPCQRPCRRSSEESFPRSCTGETTLGPAAHLLQISLQTSKATADNATPSLGKLGEFFCWLVFGVFVNALSFTAKGNRSSVPQKTMACTQGLSSRRRI
jgi:hypothetical protein